MTTWATWMGDVFRDEGLRVSAVADWETRGYAGRGMAGVRGMMHHHTAGPDASHGVMPSLRTLLVGTTVPPPLSNIGTGRDGTIFLVAAGLCNHAGKSSWAGYTGLNAWYLGNEYENTGFPTDPPTGAQLEAGARAAAAVMRHLGLTDVVAANPFHKEAAIPLGRKPDGWWSAGDARTQIAGYRAGWIAPTPPVPKVDPVGRPTLRRGSTGPSVRDVQAFLGAVVDGAFGSRTEAMVRAWQLTHGLLADGIVGPKTWASFDAAPHPGPTPAPQRPPVPAFPGETKLGSRGAAVVAVQTRLRDRRWRIDVDGRFGPATDKIVRAFQAEKGLRADGIVGPRTWEAMWTAPT